MRERIANSVNPRCFGKALHSQLKGLWRYRVQDYRILCKIEDDKLRVFVVDFFINSSLRGGVADKAIASQ
jgi:mRNA interferase RelE/StbE